MYVKAPPTSLSGEFVTVLNRKGQKLSLSTVDYAGWLIRIKKKDYVPHWDDKTPGTVYIRPLTTPGYAVQGIEVSLVEWEIFRTLVLRGRWDLRPKRTIKLKRRKSKWQR